MLISSTFRVGDGVGGARGVGKPAYASVFRWLIFYRMLYGTVKTVLSFSFLASDPGSHFYLR